MGGGGTCESSKYYSYIYLLRLVSLGTTISDLYVHTVVDPLPDAGLYMRTL